MFIILLLNWMLLLFKKTDFDILKEYSLLPLISRIELYSILESFLPILFSNSIDHILFAKPFFMTKKNIPLRKLELEYVKDDLKKYGIDVYKLLEGCLF